MPSKSDRNRRIFAAFAEGKDLEQLGEDHGVSPARICTILRDEQHRRNISPAPYYRALRAAAPLPS